MRFGVRRQGCRAAHAVQFLDLVQHVANRLRLYGVQANEDAPVNFRRLIDKVIPDGPAATWFLDYAVSLFHLLLSYHGKLISG